jgi:hypothetical protein
MTDFLEYMPEIGGYMVLSAELNGCYSIYILHSLDQ